MVFDTYLQSCDNCSHENTNVCNNCTYYSRFHDKSLDKKNIQNKDVFSIDGIAYAHNGNLPDMDFLAKEEKK